MKIELTIIGFVKRCSKGHTPLDNVGCGRMVYRFDYETKKPVVFAPLNCMVACVT